MIRRYNSRREVLAGLGAVVLAAPSVSAQAAPRVVVIGGGFGGGTAARQVKALLPGAEVVLVANERTFTACPFSNLVLAGMSRRPASGSRRPRRRRWMRARAP